MIPMSATLCFPTKILLDEDTSPALAEAFPEEYEVYSHQLLDSPDYPDPILDEQGNRIVWSGKENGELYNLGLKHLNIEALLTHDRNFRTHALITTPITAGIFVFPHMPFNEQAKIIQENLLPAFEKGIEVGVYRCARGQPIRMTHDSSLQPV